MIHRFGEPAGIWNSFEISVHARSFAVSISHSDWQVSGCARPHPLQPTDSEASCKIYLKQSIKRRFLRKTSVFPYLPATFLSDIESCNRCFERRLRLPDDVPDPRKALHARHKLLPVRAKALPRPHKSFPTPHESFPF